MVQQEEFLEQQERLLVVDMVQLLTVYQALEMQVRELPTQAEAVGQAEDITVNPFPMEQQEVLEW